MVYDNWLTRMVKSIETLNLFDSQKISEVIRIASFLDLRNDILLPSFFEQTKKEFLGQIVTLITDDNLKNESVTIGIMVKNQENKIVDCLESCVNFGAQVLVMDTGSTDSTVDKVKEFASDKVEIFQVVWEYDFSKMRNVIVEKCKMRWLLFIDSDEIIEESISPNDFGKILLLLDFLSNNQPLSVAIKQKSLNKSSYSWTERILRVADGTKFFGKVHEEIRASKGNLAKVSIDFPVLNSGDSPSEIKKFNKELFYAQLSREMIQEEPTNPKWIYCSVTALDSTNKIKLNEDKIALRTGMLIDFRKPITVKNLKESVYLHSLLQKYLFILMIEKNFEEMLTISNMSLKKYPESGSFLFFKNISKYYILEKQKLVLFREYLLDLNNVNLEKSEEITQEGIDLLRSVGIKYLFDFKNYSDATELYKELQDSEAKEILNQEVNVLKAIGKYGGESNESKNR